nr:MAG: replication associated protein [Cressdnaviricota sp.]
MDTKAKATCWSITDQEHEAYPVRFHEINQKVGYTYTGQIEECPTTKKLHFQGCLKTPQVRFSAIKKLFPKAHIEVARDRVALAKYVQKEETCVQKMKKDERFIHSNEEFWARFCSDQSVWDSYTEACMNDKEMDLFDRRINVLIRNGFRVESFGVNPQIRSIFKRYFVSIYQRHITELQDATEQVCTQIDPPSSTDYKDSTDDSSETSPTDADASDSSDE